MEYNFEHELKVFFSERVSPPPETKRSLALKIAEAQCSAERRRIIRRCMLILLYAVFFSAATVFMLWMLLGAWFIVIAVSGYLMVTIAGGIGIVLAMSFTKGGDTYAFVMD